VNRSPNRQNHGRQSGVLGSVGDNSGPPVPCGDEEFAGFVATHSRRLLHIAELLVGPGDAEDPVQGVLLRMYRRWTKIEQHEPIGYTRRALANAATTDGDGVGSPRYSLRRFLTAPTRRAHQPTRMPTVTRYYAR
jgi:hypothetical protein